MEGLHRTKETKIEQQANITALATCGLSPQVRHQNEPCPPWCAYGFHWWDCGVNNSWLPCT